jgi:hypothetical protein
MTNIGGYSADQDKKPPFIEFFVDSEEDREATMKNNGAIIMRDVDMVKIQQRGSKDFVTKRVSEWLVEMRLYSSDGRQPYEWAGEYEKAYGRFKSDQESVQGHDLRNWAGISRSTCTNLRNLGIVSVEDVAVMNESAMSKVGMGALALKQRAQAFLEANKPVGGINPEEVAQLRAQLEAQATLIADLQKGQAQDKRKQA